jgi:hypothetical protein
VSFFFIGRSLLNRSRRFLLLLLNLPSPFFFRILQKDKIAIDQKPHNQARGDETPRFHELPVGLGHAAGDQAADRAEVSAGVAPDGFRDPSPQTSLACTMPQRQASTLWSRRMEGLSPGAATGSEMSQCRSSRLVRLVQPRDLVADRVADADLGQGVLARPRRRPPTSEAAANEISAVPQGWDTESGLRGGVRGGGGGGGAGDGRVWRRHVGRPLQLLHPRLQLGELVAGLHVVCGVEVQPACEYADEVPAGGCFQTSHSGGMEAKFWAANVDSPVAAFVHQTPPVVCELQALPVLPLVAGERPPAHAEQFRREQVADVLLHLDQAAWNSDPARSHWLLSCPLLRLRPPSHPPVP